LYQGPSFLENLGTNFILCVSMTSTCLLNLVRHFRKNSKMGGKLWKW